MPTDITITAYKFSELTGSAKERARSTLTEWRTNYNWYDNVYENATEYAEQFGYYIEDIQFSGFWSQGDGASWTGEINLMEFIEKHADKKSASFGEDMILVELMRCSWVNTTMHIVRRTYHYCHENTMTYEYNDWTDWEFVSEDAVLEAGVMQGASVKQLRESFDVETRINVWLRLAMNCAKQYAKDIYRQLEQDYEHITSDEELADFADANGHLFDEDGRVL